MLHNMNNLHVMWGGNVFSCSLALDHAGICAKLAYMYAFFIFFYLKQAFKWGKVFESFVAKKKWNWKKNLQRGHKAVI